MSVVSFHPVAQFVAIVLMPLILNYETWQHGLQKLVPKLVG